MRWTVAVFVAAVTIFVAATAGMADDGETNSRLGDDERVSVTFEADVAPDTTPEAGGDGAANSSTETAPARNHDG